MRWEKWSGHANVAKSKLSNFDGLDVGQERLDDCKLYKVSNTEILFKRKK